MFSMQGLAYRRIADTAAGNLIYVLDSDGSQLALCIEHPPTQPGANARHVALRLCCKTNHGPMPLIDTGVSRCIDWGVRPTIRWNHPLEHLPRNSQQQLDTGYLLLVGDKPAITSYYNGGRGDTVYWDLLTGSPVEPGQDDFILLTNWTLGAMTADQSFLPLLSYPKDYRRATVAR
jgi:hypothetical protein